MLSIMTTKILIMILLYITRATKFFLCSHNLYLSDRIDSMTSLESLQSHSLHISNMSATYACFDTYVVYMCTRPRDYYMRPDQSYGAITPQELGTNQSPRSRLLRRIHFSLIYLLQSKQVLAFSSETEHNCFVTLRKNVLLNIL